MSEALEKLWLHDLPFNVAIASLSNAAIFDMMFGGAAAACLPGRGPAMPANHKDLEPTAAPDDKGEGEGEAGAQSCPSNIDDKWLTL